MSYKKEFTLHGSKIPSAKRKKKKKRITTEPHLLPKEESVKHQLSSSNPLIDSHMLMLVHSNSTYSIPNYVCPRNEWVSGGNITHMHPKF